MRGKDADETKYVSRMDWDFINSLNYTNCLGNYTLRSLELASDIQLNQSGYCYHVVVVHDTISMSIQ